MQTSNSWKSWKCSMHLSYSAKTQTINHSGCDVYFFMKIWKTSVDLIWRMHRSVGQSAGGSVGLSVGRSVRSVCNWANGVFVYTHPRCGIRSLIRSNNLLQAANNFGKNWTHLCLETPAHCLRELLSELTYFCSSVCRSICRLAFATKLRIYYCQFTTNAPEYITCTLIRITLFALNISFNCAIYLNCCLNCVQILRLKFGFNNYI